MGPKGSRRALEAILGTGGVERDDRLQGSSFQGCLSDVMSVELSTNTPVPSFDDEAFLLP